MIESTSNEPNGPTYPTFWEALRYWLRLGFISFGGPAGQISIMHQELVEKRRWISEGRFLHALNYCMLLPGPEAQQLATYIGWLLHRTAGGLAAGILFVLPSFFLLVALSACYLLFGKTPLVFGLFQGVKPAVVAIVFLAAVRIGTRALRTPMLWAIAAASLLASLAFHVPFPLIILAAGLLGGLGHWCWPRQFPAGSAHGAGMTHSEHRPALIDDDSPRASHTRFSWRRVCLVAVTSLGVWSIAVLALRSDALKQMAMFFSKAALLTFGGAYAVLPYVYQGGVFEFGWLTGPQMIDGLALGETTPGPLIMVVTFVGFLGGWTKAVCGESALVWSGFLGALVATYFTFLPSFALILAGGPLVESTRGQAKVTAPLAAITAAVVGVILHLGVFFAWHVLWPAANAAALFSGQFDVVSFAIVLLAFVSLRFWKRSVPQVIGLCALLGIARTAAGY